MTFIFSDKFAHELLEADRIIHQFICKRTRPEDEQPSYSSVPYNYELTSIDDGLHWMYIQHQNDDEPHEPRWGPSGDPAKAYAYHIPLHLADLEEAAAIDDEDGRFWKITLRPRNEEQVPTIACHNVPTYHLTGEHIEELSAIVPGMRFNMNFMHPHVELTLAIGDYSKTFSVIGEDQRPSHVMNAAYALAVADYLSTL